MPETRATRLSQPKKSIPGTAPTKKMDCENAGIQESSHTQSRSLTADLWKFSVSYSQPSVQAPTSQSVVEEFSWFGGFVPFNTRFQSTTYWLHCSKPPVSVLGIASSFLSSLDRWASAGTAHQCGGGNRVRIGER